MSWSKRSSVFPFMFFQVLLVSGEVCFSAFVSFFLRKLTSFCKTLNYFVCSDTSLGLIPITMVTDTVWFLNCPSEIILLHYYFGKGRVLCLNKDIRGQAFGM